MRVRVVYDRKPVMAIKPRRARDRRNRTCPENKLCSRVAVAEMPRRRSELRRYYYGLRTIAHLARDQLRNCFPVSFCTSLDPSKSHSSSLSARASSSMLSLPSVVILCPTRATRRQSTLSLPRAFAARVTTTTTDRPQTVVRFFCGWFIPRRGSIARICFLLFVRFSTTIEFDGFF